MYRFLIVVLLAGVFAGCTDDTNPAGSNNNNSTPTDSIWSDGAGGWYAMLDATSSTSYRYINLADRTVKTISPADAKTDNSWSLGLQRVEIKTNSGASGSGGVLAVDLAAIGSADSTGYDNITTAPAVSASDWRADTLKLRFTGWYNYNPSTHQISPSRKLYLMMTADGGYAKLLIDSITGAGQAHAGTWVIKYVYSTTSDLSGQAKYATVDATSGSAFFSLKQGMQVNVTNPDTSTAWDLWIGANNNPFGVRINGGISGMGKSALYLGAGLTTDFDLLTTAEPMGYFSDVNLSAFGAEGFDAMTWYAYNGLTHEIQTKGRVYIIKLADNSQYKLRINNYYRVIAGNAASGWITLRFKKL